MLSESELFENKFVTHTRRYTVTHKMHRSNNQKESTIRIHVVSELEAPPGSEPCYTLSAAEDSVLFMRDLKLVSEGEEWTSGSREFH